MPVTVHGTPGQSISNADGRFGADSRRGAFFERRVGHALERCLAARDHDTHLFHDLAGFHNVAGAGLDPMTLTNMNIDHLILGGDSYMIVDAKGCGAGQLRVLAGKGELVRHDGTVRPQPWMDNQKHNALMGVVYRLTGGKQGRPVWVIPDETIYDESIGEARFLHYRSRRFVGLLAQLWELPLALGDIFPRQPGADPVDVQRIRAHLSDPDAPIRTVSETRSVEDILAEVRADLTEHGIGDVDQDV